MPVIALLVVARMLPEQAARHLLLVLWGAMVAQAARPVRRAAMVAVVAQAAPEERVVVVQAVVLAQLMSKAQVEALRTITVWWRARAARLGVALVAP